MKQILTLLALIFPVSCLVAQSIELQFAPVRQVGGIVIDSAEHPVAGAIIILSSQMDTLKTSTNEDGIFFFKNVKAWEFTLTVRSLGYRTYVKVGRYNSSNAILTMEPIKLNDDAQILKEVVVDGTPAIKYKIDTIEYRASDYVVRDGADLGDLLTKMEGMALLRDGTLTYHGQQVKEAKLNGKKFMSGEVATVTKSLPADVVEKVQVVDDYGDQAARTGIKDKEAVKVLNITTKDERSLGYFAKLAAGAGNDSRYEGSLSATKINANTNYTLSANLSNTINGVNQETSLGFLTSLSDPANGSAPGASGGNTKTRGAGLTYRDQWGKKSQVNLNYSFSLKDNSSLDNSYTYDFSPNGTSLSNLSNRSGRADQMHSASFEFERKIDSSNYVQIIPSLRYAAVLSESRSINSFSGLTRQGVNSKIINVTETPGVGVKVFYEHSFPKRGRLFTTEASASNRNNQEELLQDAEITYFDLLTNASLKDSLINRSINRYSFHQSFRASSTFLEPLGLFSRFQFQGELVQNVFNNQTNTNDLDRTGGAFLIDSLSNNFHYSFHQAKFAFNYNLSKDHFGFRLGLAAISTELSGGSPGVPILAANRTLNLIPILRLHYRWTDQQNWHLNYFGNVTEPRAVQIQPVKDVSNPQSPVSGNPSLSPSVTHSISSVYSNFLPNSRVNIRSELTASLFENRIVSTLNQLADAYGSLKYERNFANVNGSYKTGGTIDLSKQSASRTSRFSLYASVDHQYYTGLVNNVKTISRQWSFRQRLNMSITPSEILDIYPSFSHSFFRANHSLGGAVNSQTRVFSAELGGSVYWLKSWSFGYRASKSFVNGINSNINSNPFVIDVYFQKEFLRKRGAKVSVKTFDLLNQNKLLNRLITETGITDTQSNVRSRYLTLNLNLSLQRWKGTPTRGDKTLHRRGDGSFIY